MLKNINYPSENPSQDSQLLRWGGLAYDSKQKNILCELVPSPVELAVLSQISPICQNLSSLGIMLIPTGLGCSIGGFGGDANLCAALIAEEFDYLIVNPNVVNGGAWQNLQKNMLYVEGAAIDLFTHNLIALRPVRQNKIGLLLDAAITEPLRLRELETVKAAQTIWGLNFIGSQITSQPLDLEINLQANYGSSGQIKNPEILLEAAAKLIQNGAEAIALVTNCQESSASAELNYLQGQAYDPIGGLVSGGGN